MAMNRRPNRQHHEWRVTYQRVGWTHAKARYYQFAPPAERFVEKLISGRRRDLAPLVELRLDRRTTGPWKPLELPEVD